MSSIQELRKRIEILQQVDGIETYEYKTPGELAAKLEEFRQRAMEQAQMGMAEMHSVEKNTKHKIHQLKVKQ